MTGEVIFAGTSAGSLAEVRIELRTTGIYQANCYYVFAGGQGLLIDPGANYRLLQRLVAGRPVNQIVATHCHSDHIESIDPFRTDTGATVLIADADAEAAMDPVLNGAVDDDWNFAVTTIDRRLVDGDVVTVGSVTFQVLATPGHTPGSICLYEQTQKWLFSGDTLFKGSIGRTDFIRGNPRDMVVSLRRLSALPDEVIVFPGHGPETTIGIEKRMNPFLR